MKVLILHGWAGKPFEGWRGWLGRELRTLGFEVETPYLPNADDPKQEEWVAEIRANIRKFDDNVILIGHSLGGVALLRLMETFAENERVKAAILVCTFTRNLRIDALKDFFRKPLNWGKIKKGAQHFIIINSDDDPYMHPDEGKILHENLGGERIVEYNAGHMNEAAGFMKYPRVLEMVKRLSQAQIQEKKNPTPIEQLKQEKNQ
jgi:predicted alpha/beta hydrolase family esterase